MRTKSDIAIDIAFGRWADKCRPLNLAGPTSALLKLVESASEAALDPMNDYVGFTPPGPDLYLEAERIASRHGFMGLGPDLLGAVNLTSPRWAHFNLGAL